MLIVFPDGESVTFVPAVRITSPVSVFSDDTLGIAA
jgi:hypothetical protein